MFKKNKKKGATLAYVIVVLAIVATIGTAIVALSLSNYKAIIVHGKKTENLYMSESGLAKVQDVLKEVTAKAIDDGNKAVDEKKLEISSGEIIGKNNNDGYNTLSEDISKKQNSIFKEEYKKSVINQLINNKKKSLFLYDDKNKNVKFNEELINLKNDDENKISDDGNYNICLSDINKKSVVLSNWEKQFKFYEPKEKNESEQEISFRLKSKFNVKDGNEYRNYKEVSLTFNIEVPNYNGATCVKRIPLYNILTEGLVVGDDLNIKNGSNLSIDGSVFVAANAEGDDLTNNNINNNVNSDKNINGILISGGKLYVNNGDLVSKEDIRLNSNNSILNVGTKIVDNKYGIYTGNLGINEVGIGKGKNISNSKIDSKYPAYTMNDLILNGKESAIKLDGGYYGINSNRTNEADGRINNSSAIIVNSPDIGNGSQIDIGTEAVIMGSAYINTINEVYQTGESVAIKGNYIAYTVDDGSGVSFKYYNPLQLADIKSSFDKDGINYSEVENKARYFKNSYEKNINNIKDKIKIKGISLPQKTSSIGISIDKERGVELNNLTLDKQEQIRGNEIKKYEDKTSLIKDIKSEINFPNDKINNIEDLNSGDENNLIYIDNNRYDNGDTLTIEYGNDYSLDKNFLKLKNGKASGIIITNKNIRIKSNKNKPIEFTGTIITTGSFSIDDNASMKITYNKSDMKDFLGSNYSELKNIFLGSFNDTTYLYVDSDADRSDNSFDLVKTSNWEVN